MDTCVDQLRLRIDEARRAHKVRKLIPVMVDLVELPMGFGGVQAADFSQWNGKPDAAEFIKLRDAIRRRLGNAAQAAPANVAPTPAGGPQTSPVVLEPSAPRGEAPVEDKPWFGQTAWIIIAAITSIIGDGVGYRIYGIDDRPSAPSVTPPSTIASPAPSPTAQPVANGYTVYLHTKRPQPQINALTQKLKQAGYDVASPDTSADNDSGRVSPRSGVDYSTADEVGKNHDAADKAANELFGTDIKPRPQSAMAAGKLGIWLPYTGDYTVVIRFAGNFSRDADIVPFAQKLRSAGWKVQGPQAAGGNDRDEAAAKLCEIRYRAIDDRLFAELLAADVPKTGVVSGSPSVRQYASGVEPGVLQLWIGSGICK